MCAGLVRLFGGTGSNGTDQCREDILKPRLSLVFRSCAGAGRCGCCTVQYRLSEHLNLRFKFGE